MSMNMKQVQKELYRTSILVKCRGFLCFMEVNPHSKGTGKCPDCGAGRFIEDWWSKGWTSCDNEDCDFEMLTEHLREIEKQWKN